MFEIVKVSEVIIWEISIFFSGPCGSGKTTLANAYANHLVNEMRMNQIYLIHGDDFRAGFVESDNRENIFKNEHASNSLLWNDILKFNWDCILYVAQKALEEGLDVVIDYVIEDELPLVQRLANDYDAKLYYIVLTASDEIIRQRIIERGDVELIDRALFLKNKLDNLPFNQGHLFDNTEMSIREEIERLEIEKFILK